MRRSAALVCVTALAVVSAACSSATDPSTGAEGGTGTTVTSVTTTVAPTTTTRPPGNVLVDFADPDSVATWLNQDDTVMGGVSLSTATWDDGALVFAGELSLDNGGGFTSIVRQADPALGTAATGATAIVVDATGDGRTYALQLRTSDGRRWVQSFTPPSAGGETVLPVTGFVAVDFMLDPVAPAPVDLAAIDSLAFYLVDGVEGPFRMAVASVLAR